MIHLFRGEEFKPFTVPYPLQKKYAISNLGRVISYTLDNMSDAHLLQASNVNGFEWFRYVIYKNGKRHTKGMAYHQLVANAFIPKENDEQVYVLHLDYDKTNNKVDNLMWATAKEQVAFQQLNPAVIEAREKRKAVKTYQGHKLNETQVRLIKKRILDPERKTRMRLIAKQYGISEMQLYRIKSGENWGHVEVSIKAKS